MSYKVIGTKYVHKQKKYYSMYTTNSLRRCNQFKIGHESEEALNKPQRLLKK